MNNESIAGSQAESNRRKGLYIVIAASLVLLTLVAYKFPLFNNEVYGTIVGVSEIHNETGSNLIAAVHLDTGDRVFASMPADLVIRQDITAMLNEGRTLFGHKSYSVIAYKKVIVN